MSARVDIAGSVIKLDGRAAPPSVVTSKDVQDPEKLARQLQDVTRGLSALQLQHRSTFVDFEDKVCGTGGASSAIVLPHNLGGAVRWYVVDWQISGSAGGPILHRNAAASDENTLVLWSYKAGLATIRVERVERA